MKKQKSEIGGQRSEVRNRRFLLVLSFELNPEPLNPEPLNPEPLNPEPLNPEPLNLEL
jgi:hypothetical protein